MNKNNIKITIITAVYNGGTELEDTIKSVLSQNYKNIEYIIIDGGSKDNTVDIIRKYEKNISYWVSEPDKGVYDAMNKGASKASGDYLLFTNCGDFLVDQYVISDMAKLICENDLPDWIHGRIELLEADGSNLYIKNKKVTIGCNIEKYFTPGHPAILYKKSLHDLYGGYSLDFKIAADKFLFMKILHDGKNPVIVDRVITAFKDGGLSGTSYRTPIEAFKVNIIVAGYGIKPYFYLLKSFLRIFLRTNFITKNIYKHVRFFIYKYFL